MGLVLMIHSLVRWILVVLAMVALVKFAIGWQRGGRFEAMDRGLLSGYTGMLDLQALLGLILLIGYGLTGGGWPLFRWEHAVVMILAVALAHALSARSRRSEGPARYQAALLAIVGSLVLIVVGVFALPQGWLG